MSQKEHNVIYESKNGFALVKLNRPKSGNTLHQDLIPELLSALRRAESAAEVKAIVVTGEGKFFSTGMELRDTNFIENLNTFDKGNAFHELNRTLIMCEKVLIAAVNGPCAGYGTTMLALFDLVYAVPDAYFFTPFVKWSMCAEGTSSFMFPFTIGHQKAASLFLAAEQMSAQELEQAGLISKIFPKENFLDQVLTVAAKVAEAPEASLKATKALMKVPLRQQLLDANDRECEILSRRQKTGEPQAVVAEFLNEQERKRKRNQNKL